MTPPSTSRRFLVVGMQRSGTTVTHARLAAHPRVAICEEEIHCSAFGTSVQTSTEDGETRDERTASFLAVFDGLAGPGASALAHGVKTALTDAVAAARLVGCLATHAPGIALVAVHRRDLVAQLGSLIRAQTLGTWHRTKGESAPHASVPVRIDDDRLCRYVEDCIASRRLLQAVVDRPVLHLDYEEDITTQRDWPKVTAFLGIDDGTPLVERLQKASPDPASYVVDYARLAALAAEVERRCLAAPPPEPHFTARESRVFLLHRATFRAQHGDAQAAVTDALRAMSAPPDWGVEDHRWAASLLGDVLDRAGDRDLARSALLRLGRGPAADEHVEALRRALERALGD